MSETVLENSIVVGDGAKSKRIVVLTFNRPKQRNSFNKELCRVFTEKLRDVQLYKDLVAIILIGSQACFSAGVDLKDPVFADPALMTQEFLYGPANYFWQLQHCRVPLIAAVAGPCVTGGMEVALNCDVIIASPSALFRDTHSTFGIVPSGGMTQLLPRMVGLQRAKWMSLLGQPVDAQRALQWGLVTEVVASEEQLEIRAIEVAKKLIKKAAPVNRLIKEMQHGGQGFNVAGSLMYELDIAAKHYDTMGKRGSATTEQLSSKLSQRSKL